MMKSNTVNQVKELTTPFQPDMLEPNTKADVIFSALVRRVRTMGKYFIPTGSQPVQGLPSRGHTSYTSKSRANTSGEVHLVGSSSQPEGGSGGD